MTSNYNTDICIIGSGPAGATSSLLLSKNKINHIIVDAAKFPRSKPCGDVLTAATLRILNELDEGFIDELIKQNAINPFFKNHIYTPNGSKIVIDFPNLDNSDKHSVYSIKRYAFDNFIIKKIEQSNYSQLIQNSRITDIKINDDSVKLITSEGKIIIAKMIVLATGSSNSLLKCLGLQLPKKHCAVGIRAYYKNVECDKEVGELFYDKNILSGGIYITPLPDNCYNLNMVMLLEKVNKHKISMTKLIELVIEKNPVLKRKLGNAERISDFEGSMLFLGVKERKVSGNRFLVIGDSAGLIDIISANGIPQAMTSAKIATEIAIEAVKEQNFSKDFLNRYDKIMHIKMRSKLDKGKLLFPIVRSSFLFPIYLRLLDYLAKRPNTSKLFREIMYDRNAKARLLTLKFYYQLFIK